MRFNPLQVLYNEHSQGDLLTKIRRYFKEIVEMSITLLVFDGVDLCIKMK